MDLAIVIFPHGRRRSGGSGSRLQRHDGVLQQALPGAAGVLAIVAESLGPIGLVIDLLTRVAAFGICVMVVAVLTTHTQHGFFMNWYGNQQGGASSSTSSLSASPLR
jgi:putative oxidoreductase